MVPSGTHLAGLYSPFFLVAKRAPSMQYLVIGGSDWTVFEITVATIATTSIIDVTTNRTIGVNFTNFSWSAIERKMP